MKAPLVIEDASLSVAWLRALDALLAVGDDEINIATITIHDADAPSVEDERVRDALNRALKREQRVSCETVANTIFPNSYWNPQIRDKGAALFARYQRAWPGIKKCPQNRKGVYFHRLTAYEPVGAKEPVNQLQFILETFNSGNHRRSALQASVFDPTRDHSNSPQRGFPCLQQVAFSPIGKGGLAVTGMYATQYHVEKAYGNYLGLLRLGRFMAHEMGFKLTRVTCFATVLSLGNFNKSDLRKLLDETKRLVT